MSEPTATEPVRPQTKPSPPQVSTPAGVLVRLFVLASVLWFVLPWVIGLAVVLARDVPPTHGLAEYAQLRAIRTRLERGEAEFMGQLFPEGRLFSYTFYGFALVNMAVSAPENLQFKALAVQELERLIPIAEHLANQPPFDRNQFAVPPGGIIPVGQANLLRAGYAILGGQRQDILDAYHRVSAELHAAYMASPTGSLETYAGQIWPVDNCCALQSLYLYDRLYGTRYGDACERWSDWMAGHLDKDSGMMVAQITSTGGVEDGPRGCALSWSLAFMSTFAPDLARSQYERYRSEWFIHVLGITGIREWAPGRQGRMDVDTGPVIAGVGLAATGFGIAAAKAQNDLPNLKGLLSGLELLGFPLWTPLAQKHYFLGKVLLPDVLALWGRTFCDWSQPAAQASIAWPAIQNWGAWSLFVVAVLVAVLLVRVALGNLRKAYRGLGENPLAWSWGRRAFVVIDLAALACWLILPPFSWLYALLLMGLAEIVETRLVARKKRSGVMPVP